MSKKKLELKANKKMVKDELVKSTGKALVLKDLSNLMTKSKSSNSRNDLEATVKNLTDKYGECITINPHALHATWFMICLFL